MLRIRENTTTLFDWLTWKLWITAQFTSTTTLSFHNVDGARVSTPRRVATSLKHKQNALIEIFRILLYLKCCKYALKYMNRTSRILNLCGSHRSREPISVTIYQPLKGAAGNSNPPTSNNMLETAGNAYHCKFSSENHGYLKMGGNKQLSVTKRFKEKKNALN